MIYLLGNPEWPEDDLALQVFIVVIKTRHAEVEVLPFSDKTGALLCANTYLSGITDPDWSELTAEMLSDGWVFHVSHGEEGEYVRVVRRTLDRTERNRRVG
ncbi:MAG TPA: hypothetical protein VGR71_16765 [Nitrospira sp.]|nr:hypothetical protein [Nitrospira sp.]